MRWILPGLLATTLAAFAARAEPPRINPLDLQTPDGRVVESCADPTVIASHEPGETAWYMYCTADPLGDWDRDETGAWVYHLVPVFRSVDLVHWTWQGDALASRPDWAEPSANVWAPEVEFHEGRYHLYFAVTNTKPSISGEPGCADDSAIAVATSPTPVGPFEHAALPVVRPRRGGPGCDFLATIDPDVLHDPSGDGFIYYGSFYGGVEVRRLSPDGLVSLPATALPLTVWDRYEAPLVLRRGGFYYLFLSAAGCCNGPLSGYLVYAGRSDSPTGPFVDRDGIRLDAPRTGGTPVLAANGERWVGPGHNTVAVDGSGRDWAIYHAIDVDEPWFDGSVGFTKRPALLDPLDWPGGWPTVRGGWWASDCPQPAPATGETGASRRPPHEPGVLLPDDGDEFDEPSLRPGWEWLRRPADEAWGVADGVLRLATDNGDLHLDADDAPVLLRDVPPGDWLLETRVHLDVPGSGCCYNYRQAGLVLHADDDNYLKLVHVSIWSTRVTEWAKELAPVPAGWPRYDKTFVGPPADWTWLRIVREQRFDDALYTAYTSRDGLEWLRGASWQHRLGDVRLGLVAMGGAGSTARFDYVRFHRLAPWPCEDEQWADPCDRDGDGSGDSCDPDDDGDGIADLTDCAARDAAAGRPAPIAGVVLRGADPTVLSWPPAPTAEAYDLTRGALGELGPGRYGPCLADDHPDDDYEDAARPVAGAGFGYLVRGVDFACGGGGSWGHDAAGAERRPEDPDACP